MVFWHRPCSLQNEKGIQFGNIEKLWRIHTVLAQKTNQIYAKILKKLTSFDLHTLSKIKKRGFGLTLTENNGGRIVAFLYAL